MVIFLEVRSGAYSSGRCIGWGGSETVFCQCGRLRTRQAAKHTDRSEAIAERRSFTLAPAVVFRHDRRQASHVHFVLLLGFNIGFILVVNLFRLVGVSLVDRFGSGRDFNHFLITRPLLLRLGSSRSGS